MTIYEKIRALRISQKLSQTDLAMLVGYKSGSMITKIESGAVDLSQKKVYAFAKALNTSPAYLMGWVSDPSPRTDDASSSPDPISDAELRLISDYRQLNTKGKEYVLQQVRIAQVMFGEKSDTFPADASSVK